jgi:hypothetical protein
MPAQLALAVSSTQVSKILERIPSYDDCFAEKWQIRSIHRPASWGQPHSASFLES